jgi:alkaline phosphatase
MVEAGRIDHGHHAGNAQRALHDAVALDAAVAVAMAETNPAETLIVVTADHGHTFTIGGYPTRGNPIFGVVTTNDDTGRPESEPMRDASGNAFTTLAYANGPGHLGASNAQPAGAKHFPHFAMTVDSASAGRPQLTNVDTEALDYLQESAVPLVAETHGGEDVAIFAGGAGAALFHGVQEQSFIYHAIVEALGWTN